MICAIRSEGTDAGSRSVTTRTRTTSMRDASTIAYADSATASPEMQRNDVRPAI